MSPMPAADSVAAEEWDYLDVDVLKSARSSIEVVATAVANNTDFKSAQSWHPRFIISSQLKRKLA